MPDLPRRRAGDGARLCAAALILLLATACGAAPGAPATPANTGATTAPPATTTAAPLPAPATAPVPAATTTAAVTTTSPEPWQVPGRRHYFPVQPSAAATYGEAHHDYPAADIFAPAGTTVVAVTGGVVEALRRDDPWDPGRDDPATRGGRFVSLLGDDGVRYYFSHLQSVADGLEAGDRVVGGQAIGEVGASGNAAGTPPHCHFGISRPTFPGDWEVRRGEVEPYAYLQAWEQGADITPVLPAG